MSGAPNPFGHDVGVTVWIRHLEQGLASRPQRTDERCSVCLHYLEAHQGDYDEAYGEREFLRLRCPRCREEENDELRGGA